MEHATCHWIRGDADSSPSRPMASLPYIPTVLSHLPAARTHLTADQAPNSRTRSFLRSVVTFDRAR
ncbi:hypothetical protein CALCODRAFT_307944 [Calocera cornea HHB12733]|uniref:Uncharacterized protein n=1 Tax=Calocera cornea HHB12733 TaxID=1353952 RepID=A0A165JND1_9BASI|nr:hypothetical protein CALCODRAFT_307944 [Calocera cornea HHB12733]